MATKVRRRIPEKLRAFLQQEISSKCPICANTDVGHFQVHHIDENPENNEPENLLMLCANCHSKITKGDISFYEVKGIKNTLVNYATLKTESTARATNNFNGNVSNTVVGDNNVIHLHSRTSKKSKNKEKYSPGCVGYDAVKANYVSYLINRYHEFKKWEMDTLGEEMKYYVFPSKLKKHFKIGSQRTIYHLPEERFDELVAYIQRRIEQTKLVRTSKSGDKYQSFVQYLSENS